jgi:hypothetical protein
MGEEGGNERETRIIRYLLASPGILGCIMRRERALGKRIAAWLTGEKPILLIGGEPGNGKSLLMGELVLRYSELARIDRGMRETPALISYDRVHYLFLKRLMERKGLEIEEILPEGETHPEARKMISAILRDVLVFAARHLPENTSIVLEAPLIGHRGENLIEAISALGFKLQILIIYSSVMWGQMLYNQQEIRETSARALAMKQIHEALLRQRGIELHPKQTEDKALVKSWRKWLDHHEGMVLSWDPVEDESGFIHTREALQAEKIPPDPLTPSLLHEHAADCIERMLNLHPNPEAFASEVRRYGH